MTDVNNLDSISQSAGPEYTGMSNSVHPHSPLDLDAGKLELNKPYRFFRTQEFIDRIRNIGTSGPSARLPEIAKYQELQPAFPQVPNQYEIAACRRGIPRGVSSEKENKTSQVADASNGFPKPSVPVTFSLLATSNSGPSFSAPAQSPFATGFSFSSGPSSGAQSFTSSFSPTYSFPGPIYMYDGWHREIPGNHFLAPAPKSYTDHLRIWERASWNNDQTEFLLQLLQCFPRAQRGGWSEVTWKLVDQAMRENFPYSDFRIEQLKQKEKDMRKLYHQVQGILRRPGFQWDDKNCMLIASNDCWRKLIEESIQSKGKLSCFRGKIIPHYAALVALHEGPHVIEAELATKLATMQIGGENTGHQVCANVDGLIVNLSPTVDEMAPPLSQVSSQNVISAENYSHDHENLLSSPFDPQYNRNRNPINPCFQTLTPGPSNFQQSLDFPQDQFLFPESENLMDNSNISATILDQPLQSTNILSCGVPPFHGFENQTQFNNNSNIASHSTPLCPVHASNSDNPAENNSFSLKRAHKRKVRGKRNFKKTGAAKLDNSMGRCIKIIGELKGFRKSDIERTVEIFKDKLNREAFIAMKTIHKVDWLKSKLSKKQA